MEQMLTATLHCTRRRHESGNQKSSASDQVTPTSSLVSPLKSSTAYCNAFSGEVKAEQRQRPLDPYIMAQGSSRSGRVS